MILFKYLPGSSMVKLNIRVHNIPNIEATARNEKYPVCKLYAISLLVATHTTMYIRNVNIDDFRGEIKSVFLSSFEIL